MKKKGPAKSKKWEMRKEYDFSQARPNRYAKKYAEGTNIVMIDPDLVQFFPDSKSINATLRALVALLPESKSKAKSKKGSPAPRQKSPAV